MQFLFSRRLIGVGAVIAAFAVLPVQAASADTDPCSNPPLSQPFLSLGDQNWYTLVPGESADNFDGTGWTLSGGASIVTTTLADGTTGQVLDLPPGSRAVSPPMCVATGYPLARMMTRFLGSSPNNSTSFTVGPVDASVLGGPSMPVLGKQGWTLSPPVNVLPGSVVGSKQVQFTFVANAKVGDLQVYNLDVDPRMRC